MKDIVIIGTENIGKEVVKIIEAINSKRNTWNVLGFISLKKDEEGSNIVGYSVLGSIDSMFNYFEGRKKDKFYFFKKLESQNELFTIIAIDNCKLKKEIENKLKNKIKFATIIIFYVLHILSYKVDPLLFKAPLQFLFYFSMGFAFESKREKYNQFISKKRNYVLILSMVFVLITLLNFNLKYTYTLVSKILVELLAILGSLLTYSISYLISRKERSGSSYFFKLILMNGLGIYIFSDPLNYLILYISYSLNSQFMFSPFGIIFMVVLRFFITLFVSLIVTVIFKKCFKKYTWLVN